jgi:hypothetical protein
MILCAHADAGFHNESKGRSRAGAHIFVSKNESFPKHNGPLLSISQIMKFVVSSAAKAKLGALYTTAKEMVPLRQTLIKMGWPQPRTPIQTDNSSAVGITNLTILPQKSKSMDLCLWWLQCQESQQQFRYYWDKGKHNWADYHTKHHPPTYHKSNRLTCKCSRPVIILICCPTQALLRFPNNKPTSTLVSFFEHNLECHCKGVLFTYYLHTVRIFMKLVTLLLLTLLLQMHLLRYLDVSGCT